MRNLQEILPQAHTHRDPQIPMDLHTRHSSPNFHKVRILWNTATRIMVWLVSQLTQATVMYNCNSTSVQSHTQLPYQLPMVHYHNSCFATVLTPTFFDCNNNLTLMQLWQQPRDSPPSSCKINNSINQSSSIANRLERHWSPQTFQGFTQQRWQSVQHQSVA